MKTRMAQTAAHPERFVTGRPQPVDLPTAQSAPTVRNRPPVTGQGDVSSKMASRHRSRDGRL